MFVMFISAVYWHCLWVTSLGRENEIDWWQLGCILMKATAMVLIGIGMGVPPPPLYFFIVDIIAVICFCSHAASLCYVSSVYTILAVTLSHKPLEPGVGACALSTLLCWVRHFVYRLASTPIAIQLNPISGSTISQAQDCNAAICILTLSCTVRVGDTWWAASPRTTC